MSRIYSVWFPMEPQPTEHGVCIYNDPNSYGADVDLGWWEWNGQYYGDDIGVPFGTACPLYKKNDFVKGARVTDVSVDARSIDGPLWWVVTLERTSPF